MIASDELAGGMIPKVAACMTRAARRACAARTS